MSGGGGPLAAPDTTIALDWTGEGLRFSGGAPEGPEAAVDGDGAAAPSPMQALLLALAGCMGSDIVDILGRMRISLGALRIRVEGRRAAEPPRRYTALRLVFEAEGVAPQAEAQLRRAVSLSEEKYCSVLHSLREDIDWGTEVVLR